MIEQKIKFYKFNSKIGIVEVFIPCEFRKIKDKLDDFTIEDLYLPKDEWQVLYMEQYFNADRSQKLCETYDEPADDEKNFYLVFFIYKLLKGQTLNTPFGRETVTKLEKMPREYKKTLEFEKMD